MTASHGSPHDLPADHPFLQTQGIAKPPRHRRGVPPDHSRRAPGGSIERRPSPSRRLPVSPRVFWPGLIGAVLLVWTLSGLAVRAFSSGEILPGTSIQGVELGGQTRESAIGPIERIEPQTLKLAGPERTVTIRAPQAGLVIDPVASAERAYSSGRNGVAALLQGPLVLLRDRDLLPVYRPADAKRLASTINRIADRIDRRPFVGALDIDPETLEVTAEQPKAGVEVRRDLTRERILDAFATGDRSIEIPAHHRAAPDPAEVTKDADQAREFLREPVRIETMGGPAEFTPAQMAGVLVIESTGDDSSTGVRLGADREAVESLVGQLADERDRPARDARLVTPALPPVNLSEQGDLGWQPKPDAATVKPGRNGRVIGRDESVKATVKAVQEGSHEVRFPTERDDASVTTAMLKDATSLLGTFTTSFSCCEPRVTNIQTIARTVDGTVIGPGEQFSLNGISGERTEAKGYKSAPTIGEGNTLVDSVGGGVSQFSTTTYNAAYFAGLQIDAHTPHSFYIDRYPA
ncbi:MAG: VanW family protein, partial [Solirubrobacterales bacterium]|nr:VanW family protein [Solirubrobacterales bacterium]